ncbi:MAG: CPBP family intramembrane metalloprotease [Anaerolineales bacterium]|nr:MAG: CPBP family intramembrane metalloprotease [Anaerolineales bacterium]
MAILTGFIQARIYALILGLLAWPHVDEWLFCGLAALLFGLFARWFGLRSGLIKKEKTALSSGQRIVFGVRVFLHPALVEESIFRGLLLPSPASESLTPAVATWYLVSLLLFIGAHPLNGFLLRKSARRVFTNPAFITLAGLLGLFASAMYAYSGSLWPPILFHGVMVYTWLVHYGGIATISKGREPLVPLA